MISVIIPIYNLQNNLKYCLDSLLVQTYKDFEAILINDGSIDNSAIICKNYVEKDKRFRYFEQNNLGLSSARNTGLANAQGEYVAFVDGDDIVAPFYLECLFDSIGDNVMSSCLYERITSYNYILIDNCNKFIQLSSSECAKKVLLGKFPISVWGKIFSRNAIDKLRFSIDIKNNEDKLFLYNFLINNKDKKIIFTNKKMYGYYVRNNSLSNKGWISNFNTISASKEINRLTIKTCPEWKELSTYNLMKARINTLKSMIYNIKDYRDNKLLFNQIRNEVLMCKIPSCASNDTKIEYITLKLGNIFFIILVKVYLLIMNEKMRNKRDESFCKQHK